METVDSIKVRPLVDFLRHPDLSCTIISEETGTSQIGSPFGFYLTIDTPDGI